MCEDEIKDFLKYYDCDFNTEYIKDYSILENFSDEELAQELIRRTDLGKELC